MGFCLTPYIDLTIFEMTQEFPYMRRVSFWILNSVPVICCLFFYIFTFTTVPLSPVALNSLISDRANMLILKHFFGYSYAFTVSGEF